MIYLLGLSVEVFEPDLGPINVIVASPGTANPGDIVNTSFNVRGEPIVCSPEDAFRCFMGTDLDALVIENFYLEKNMQDSKLYEDYKNKYELD